MRRDSARQRAANGLVMVLLPFLLGRPAAAGVYYVDNSSPASSDDGLGTEAQPYRTISAAVATRGGAGTSIIVKPGTYREDVEILDSSYTNEPFVIQALGPGVVVDGADDLSGASNWAQISATVYVAASVTWNPVQVFVDGALLTPSPASPDSLPINTFRYVPSQGLYVNLGGGNPGTHATLVGRRVYGIHVGVHANVTIEGFHVTRAEDRGIYIEGRSDGCVIRGNQVDHSHRYGIAVEGCNGVLIEHNLVIDNNDNGIALTVGSSGCTVQDNECALNAVPGGFRNGSGIYLSQSSGNLIQRNRLHDNEDEGLNITAGSNNNLSIHNLAWHNADHGFDNFGATGNMHIGDVASDNLYDGFAIDQSATGTQLYDCIAVNNGLTENRFDLWVDEGSTSGFESDYNLFWNSTSRPPIRYAAAPYSSIAAYSAASGEDPHSLQADPQFVDPSGGDFNLMAGSPAIDSGDSNIPGWPMTDAEGNSRVDDPQTPDTGTGPVPYTDRGALEYNAHGTLAVGTPRDLVEVGVSPNPFESRARLVFRTITAGHLSARILDTAGRLVCRLADEPQAPAGFHVLTLDTKRDDGQHLRAGIYFYDIRAGDAKIVGRFAVLR